MVLSLIDIVVFFGFMITVVAVGILKSRKESTSEDSLAAGGAIAAVLSVVNDSN